MDIKSLKKIFKEHEAVKFPAYSKPAELADWIADLAELDAYIAGIASSLIHGEAHEYRGGNKLHEMEERFNDICKSTTVSEATVKSCKRYLKSLEHLVKEIEL